MRKSPNTVYIGYDPREDVAYEVLKFTIERIDELETQIAHVGRLHQKIARSVVDEPKRRLVVLPHRFCASDEASRGLRHIGIMQDGKQVYESVDDGVLVKKPRLFYL